MDYAVIRIGNKQHRVRDGESIVVERVRAGEGESFEPEVLLGGAVTATVVAHERGPKLVVGKYRRRTGYRRHNGFRAATTRLRISLRAAGTGAAPAEPRAEAPAPPRAARPPKGYEELTVAAIREAAPGWRRPQLEAALAWEREHAARKGAIAALEAALEAKGEG
jgi:large subunit ribosomal protein L21